MQLIIFLVLFTLFSFYNYYNLIVNSFYADNSYFLIKSDSNMHTTLLSMGLKKIETGTIYKPKDANNPIITIHNENKFSYDEINWQTFINNDFNGILIFHDSNILNDNEIEISFPKYYDSFYKNITINNDLFIKLNLDSNDYIFKIKEYSFKDCYQINVSEKIFSDLLSNSKTYIYKVNITPVNNYKKIYKKLQNKCNDGKQCEVKFYEFNNYNQLEVEKTINNLNKIIIIFECIFIITFIIIIFNIIHDEKDLLIIYKKIGFRNIDLKLILFAKILFIITTSVFLAYISLFVELSIINKLFNLKLKLIKLFVPLFLSVIFYIISFIICNLYKINLERG